MSRPQYRLKTYVYVMSGEKLRLRAVGRLNGNPFDGGAIPFQVPYGHILGGPQVYVSTVDAARLESMEGARAHLRVSGRHVPGRRDRNVLAELPGASEETVIVSAHHDSVWRGTGTIDNATAAATTRSSSPWRWSRANSSSRSRARSAERPACNSVSGERASA